MKKNTIFKKKLNELADLALDISGTKSNYSDEDLACATLVLVEVLFNKEHDKYCEQLSFKKMLDLAEKTGQTLRDFIKICTGVDLHKVFKK